jgi:hypothetical protein
MRGGTVEVIITNGTQFGDVYKEISRSTISTPSADPKIGEILAQAKRMPQPSYMESLVPYFYLMHPVTLQRLDESTAASAYGLQDGSILRLMCLVR